MRRASRRALRSERRVLDRHTLFLIVLGLSVVNGIFSPYLNLAIPVTAVLLPELFPRSVEWVLFWSSILFSSATLLLSGVPAALYERLAGEKRESTLSMWIWIAGAATLSLPAVQRFL
jgi:hypothetical protein